MIVLGFFTRAMGQSKPQKLLGISRDPEDSRDLTLSLLTHRLHSFRDANCKSSLQRVFFSKMKLQMSNSIIVHKYVAEDLANCPGGALLGERVHPYCQ